ncbi:MAG: DUF1800 domain-containing protein [Thaumarchaeota archaeon]|nr:DUF1800 domain-containing protein [Nitrososphaerota archaeon]
MDRREFLKVTLAAAAVTVAGLYGLDALKAVNSVSLTLPPIEKVQGQVWPIGPETRQIISLPEVSQIPHLLRRAGFGGGPAELAEYEGMGFTGAVDHLLNYEGIDNSQVPATPAIVLSYSGTQTGNVLQALQTWWLQRMVGTTRPLEEKMTLFWHNHFATGFSKVENGYLMYKQNDFLRTNALGNFHDILTGMTADGAMLVWLDGNQNRKGNPNENYAREVMEVFSTGRGPYTEEDVAAGALAFTGYGIDSNGDGVFNPNLHDSSIKTFMGTTGNLGPADIIDILVAHPATATNLATELFEFFAYPNPGQDTITRLAQVYLNSGYSIRSLVQAILTSPEFISTQAYLANIKSPAEYTATALRSLGATTSSLGGAVAAMGNMGQALFNPPSVFGWPSGSGWINTASILARYNFPTMVQTTEENPASGLDAAEIFGAGVQDGAGVQTIANHLFPDGVPANLIQVIDQSTSAIPDAVTRTKDAVRLVMCTPYYNLN